MPDYRTTATLAKLELALIRHRVDGDYLTAKLGAADVRELAAVVDPDDASGIEKLAADVLKMIPSKFVKATTTRAPKEAREFTAEQADAIRARVAEMNKAQSNGDAQRRQFESLGVLQPRRGE